MALPSRPERHRPRRDERGAVIVETAIAIPLLFTLLLGMFTGGLAYDRKLAIVNGVREGSRFGATLPVVSADACSRSVTLECWLKQVADIVEQASEGQVSTSVGDRRICVAYVYPAGETAATVDQSNRVRRLVRTSSGGAAVDTYDVGASATCFADGRTSSTEKRVQVQASRTTKLELLLTSQTITLSSKSVTRFEAG